MLLERDGQLAELERIRATASSGGGGSVVLVAGEAGVGKTSLINTFCESLDASTLVIRGACDPLTTPRPLGPVHDFVAQSDSGLSDLDLASMPSYDVFDEILDRLRVSIRPIIMIIEDVHWADGATLDLIRFLGRRIAPTTAAVLITYRADEVVTGEELRNVLGDLMSHASTRRIKVPPLSLEAVAQLASSSSMDPQSLFERTGGNAFFATEVLASGSSLPTTVIDAVVARTHRLPDGARSVARAISISPSEMSVDSALALSGQEMDALDEAVESGVLVSSGSRIHFRHEIARSAIEDTLPSSEALRLHRIMIDLLEKQTPPDASRLAHHAEKALDDTLTARYAPAAGDDAVLRGARREAIAFYSAALNAREALPDSERASVLLRLGEALTFVEDHQRAISTLRDAIALFLAQGRVEEAARALIVLQTPVWILDGRDAAIAVTEEALRLLEPLGDTETLALGHVRVAHNNMIARDLDSALASVERALVVANAVGSEEMAWRGREIGATVELVMGDAEAAVRALRDLVSEARSMGRHDLEGHALGMLGSGAGEARLYSKAEQALRESIELGTATDDDVNANYSRAWLDRIGFERGRWTDVLNSGLARNSGIRADVFDASDVTAATAHARTLIRKGVPGGLETLRSIVARADAFLLQYVWNAYSGIAEYLWLQNRGEQARDVVGHAFERALASDSPWARGEIGFWLWRIGAIDGPPDGAAEPFALQMAGDWEAAAKRWDVIGCPYEVAMALADGDEASQRRAVEILDDLGARPAAGLVRQRLRDAGATGIPRGPTARTRSHPAGLTARQHDVLQLVARGLTNAEIADRLYVSKKTVEHHVSAVYAKLGVEFRTQAIALAIDLGLVTPGGTTSEI